MKSILVLFLMIFLMPSVSAVDTAPAASALPGEAEEYMGGMTAENGDAEIGIKGLFSSALNLFPQSLKKTAASAFCILGVCAVSSGASAFASAAGGGVSARAVDMAAVCGILALSGGGVDGLMKSCADAVASLGTFSAALLPVFASAAAIAGKPVSAVASSGAAMAFSALLTALADKVFLPGVYLYLAASAAGLIGESRLLKKLAELVRWACHTFFRLFLTAFMFYISVSGVVSGGADAAAVKTARVTISTVLPVLGGIVSDASDAILAGAGVIRSAVGAFGLIGACAICLVPFVTALAGQLVFKIVAAAASAFAGSAASAMLDAVASAYGLVMGILGSCCALQFISIVVSTVVTK